MNAADWSDPGDIAGAPNEVALAVVLARMRRADKPRAVITREVVVRLAEGDDPYSTVSP